MDKLDKLKVASSSLGERLKTGSAQMSRIVSTKMKEILQGPTPESKLVEEATSETMEEPNWSLNLRICAMINSEEFNGAEVVKAIKKKLVVQGKGHVGQRLSLDLLETCTSNCEKVFSEVASEKVLDDMIRMIDDPRSDLGNRAKAMQLIRAWGESHDLEYLPVFRQTYMNLKTRQIPPEMHDGSAPPMQYPLESYVSQQPLSPPDSYPIPHTGLQNDEHTTYMGESLEEKKEFLVITRNSLEILSSILDSEVEPKPIKDDLAVSMVENCKQSLAVIQRIVETISDDEGMLFESLNLHDELRQVISRYEEMEASLESGGGLPKTPETVSDLPDVADTREVNLEKPASSATESHAVASPKGESNHSGHEDEKPGVSGDKRVD